MSPWKVISLICRSDDSTIIVIVSVPKRPIETRRPPTISGRRATSPLRCPSPTFRPTIPHHPATAKRSEHASPPHSAPASGGACEVLRRWENPQKSVHHSRSPHPMWTLTIRLRCHRYRRRRSTTVKIDRMYNGTYKAVVSSHRCDDDSCQTGRRFFCRFCEHIFNGFFEFMILNFDCV